MSNSSTDGAKKFVPRHRGRRGKFWSNPGTSASRGNMDAAERTIERRVRRAGKKEIATQRRED